MVKLIFYVPPSHLEVVKEAVFDAGAGKIGNYDQCCWQILGQGQYRPLSGANAYIGHIDQLESVDEYRVELVVSDSIIQDVVVALKNAHPYEEPAYGAWKLLEV